MSGERLRPIPREMGLAVDQQQGQFLAITGKSHRIDADQAHAPAINDIANDYSVKASVWQAEQCLAAGFKVDDANQHGGIDRHAWFGGRVLGRTILGTRETR